MPLPLLMLVVLPCPLLMDLPGCPDATASTGPLNLNWWYFQGLFWTLWPLTASTRAGGPPWSYADGLLELELMLLDVLDLWQPLRSSPTWSYQGGEDEEESETCGEALPPFLHVGIFLLFIMKHEDSGRRMKEEWIMEILRVSAVLLHVMFMKLYFSRAIFLYEVVMIRQQGSMCVMRSCRPVCV